ncbi:alpha/beta hydrolase [Chitinophaga qingshengii]|uniref:Alpha/beta hydrolase n=1 Tax=Chitinophaga qingshengii TaxID=1569794 RepID=A0ABR7TIP8_9BACT|nr:alpha/beta hydrolase [Chitinophaga qingshengii]MBC9929838.1 alpha/beta hydrolase [Chitinophaga qingshengii]
MEKINLAAFRKELEEAATRWSKEKMPVKDVTDKQIHQDLSIRIYRQQTTPEKLPVLLFLHGGGWVRGNLQTHDDLCRQLAAGGHFMVISVNYRLAPEHPFPYAINDAFTALQWIIAHADDIRANAGSIAVGGDSSGGNLAIALLQQAMENDITLKGLVVAYPPLNYQFDTPSYIQYAEGYGLTKDLMKQLWDMYLGDVTHAKNRLASVIQNDFSGYPPTLIIGSDKDPLHEDGRQLFNKMVLAAVAVTYSFYPGTRHAFLLRTAIEKAATTAQQEIIGFLKNKIFIS